MIATFGRKAADVSTRRRVTRAAAVLPLSVLLLVAAAPAALAAISGIGRGDVVRTHRTIQIVADHGATTRDDPPRLTLTEPGQPPVVVASTPVDVLTGDGQLSYAFNTRCWVRSAPTNPCATGPQPARNGEWVAAQSGGAVDSVPFTLSIPPDAPTGVTAAPGSPQEMRISWRRGAEPDLTSYTVLEGDQAVRRDLAPKDVCNNDSCSTSVPVEGSGERAYTVVAFRSSGTSDPALASARSAPASASLVGDPLASPGGAPPPGVPGVTPSASPTASPSPTTKAAPRPGKARDPKPLTLSPDAGARRQAFASGFNAFGPKLGIPKLPPLPESPEVALPDGTFERELGYDDQVLSEEETELGADEQGVRGAVGSLVDSEQLAKSTAGALVLLLTGAHLRRWLGATSAE